MIHTNNISEYIDDSKLIKISRGIPLKFDVGTIVQVFVHLFVDHIVDIT